MCSNDLQAVKEALIYQLTSNIDNLDCLDTKELNHIVHMIKNIDEAMYYCTITEAMHSDSSTEVMNYGGRMGGGKLYYSASHKDPKEGKSYMSRKTYMEDKEKHIDRTTQLKDLELYANELTSDIMDMIASASTEEKQMLQSKIATLANKIV